MNVLDIRPVAANAELTIAQQLALEAPCSPTISHIACDALRNPIMIARAFRPSWKGCIEAGFGSSCAAGMMVVINYTVGPLAGECCLAPMLSLFNAIKIGALSGLTDICLTRIEYGVNDVVQAGVSIRTHQVFIQIIQDDPILGNHRISAQFRENLVLAPEHLTDAETRATLIQRFTKFQKHAFLPLDVQRVLELCVKNGLIDRNDLRTPAERATYSSLGCVPKELLGDWITKNLEALNKAEAQAAQPPAVAIQMLDEEKGDVVVAYEAPERPAPRQQNGAVHWVKWLFGCARTPC